MTDTDRAAIGWAVTQLVFRAAALTDAAAWEELAALYTDDGVLARPSAPNDPIVGRAAILAASRSRPPRRSRHLVSNVIVDVISADEARTTAMLTLFTGPADGDEPVDADPVVAVGETRDVVRRVDGEWRFASRSGSIALRYRPAIS